MLEEERKSLSIEERSKILAEFIDKRKKMLAAKRAEEKRNEPPTYAQQRTYMSNYLKHIGGYTLKQLKQYLFKEIKMLFDNTMESYCKGDVGYYEIHRADGSYKTYIFFSEMLNDFDREDLIVLHRFFNKKNASRPRFDDLMLWGDIKIMFEPDDDDKVWKSHHNQELIEWKLYDSCGIHSLMLGEIHKRIEKVEENIEGLVDVRVIIQRDFDSLETELQKARTQIARLQREQMGHNDEIVLACVRISTLEMIIEDI
nr:hypothetical protein [Tanacetum cinerariifolium]